MLRLALHTLVLQLSNRSQFGLKSKGKSHGNIESRISNFELRSQIRIKNNEVVNITSYYLFSKRPDGKGKGSQFSLKTMGDGFKMTLDFSQRLNWQLRHLPFSFF